ncbi:MAG: LacI family DNA-binding transcriptional regulator [Clostridia bacterium]|nr:LacI family DNA-binding transcriptional regulator [Clostridia bacterium]
MISRITLVELAKKSGISKSVLSRALNNSPGVDYETWKAAKKAAETFGYRIKPLSGCQVGVILPSTPGFFWHGAYLALNAPLAESYPRKAVACYPGHSSAEDICSLIDEMAESGVNVLILPVTYVEVKEHLEKYRDVIGVFQLCEYTELDNSFIFASDGYSDGRTLAEFILSRNPDSRALIIESGTDLSKCRISGFTDNFPGDRVVGSIDAPQNIPTRYKSSVYASRMSEVAGDTPPDYVVCSSGMLTYAAAAIIKCGWRGKTRCVGFETPPTLSRYVDEGLIAATIEQDIIGECVAAEDAARRLLTEYRHPPRRYNFIPGRIHIFEPSE